MKNYIFSFLLLLLYSNLTAQYDFPATTNGLSIGLDLNGEQTVFATDFLSTPTDECSAFGEVLINRSTLQFPRGSEPPASAGESLTFDCNDFGTESIELWYRDQFGNWLVADSYVVIFGLQNDCGGCEGDDCQSTSPIAYNGFSISFPGGVDNLSVNARELVSRTALPNENFSFSATVTDTVRAFSCSGNSLIPVLIFSHRDGFTARAASTYVTLANGENCGDNSFSGDAARVIQGLSVPNSSAEIVTVPARAFAPKYGPAQQLSFSADPADTLFTLTCEQIGAGGIFINVHNHISGTPGPPALTYLTGDDTQNHCDDATENTAANDSIANALLIDSCRRFHQFTRASTEIDDAVFAGGGNSVWHTIPVFDDIGNSFLKFNIDAVDTIKYALFIKGFLLNPYFALADSGTVIGSDTIEYSECIINNRTPNSVDSLYLQISGLSAGAVSRYYLSADRIECPSATKNKALSTLKSFPNPTSGITSIEVPQELSSRATIGVFNQEGHRVQQYIISNLSDKIDLDLASQPPGIYYVRLSDANKAWVSKVVVYR